MEGDFLTVAIPCYNGEKTIERCVNSILDQDYHNFELLIINDGSTDNTLSLVEKISRKDSRIRIISQVNKGLSASRNRGIDEARGKYISFIDADDYIRPGYLSEMYEAIVKTGAELAVCRYYTDSYNDIQDTYYLIEKMKMYKELFIPQINIAGFAWNRMYSLELIRKYKLKYDVRIYGNEDALFNYKYLNYCNKVAVVNKELYQYIINDNSIMFSRGFSPRRMLANIAFDEMLTDAKGKAWLEYVQIGATWYNLILKRRIILSRANVSKEDMSTVNRMLRLNPKAFIKSDVPLKYRLAYLFWMVR